MFRGRFGGRGTWWARDFSGPEDWSYRLGPDLDIAAIRQELFGGRGFVVIRGVREEEYLPVAGQFGRVMAQNARGDLLYSVRNEGQSIARDYGQVGVRFSKTNLGLDSTRTGDRCSVEARRIWWACCACKRRGREG